jgi:hypothetical protein
MKKLLAIAMLLAVHAQASNLNSDCGAQSNTMIGADSNPRNEITPVLNNQIKTKTTSGSGQK